MFTGLIPFVRRIRTINSHGNILFHHPDEIKRILSRTLFWSSKQSTEQTFGRKLKRRLRNLLIISVVTFGAIKVHQKYRSHQWLSQIDASEKTIDNKPRIVVLGTGWGAVPFLRHIDSEKYDVTCVSPRNYFLMTPLLPSNSVGTVETRTIVESIRSLIGARIKYIEAYCIHVDSTAKVIKCTANEQDLQSRDYNITILGRKDGASSRVVKDSTHVRPMFDMNYDILVVAIGSETNTFDTPGVEEHAHFLKEISDARRIRSAISDAFESAITPTQSEEERKRLTHFVIVGGGPTGVELAAELNDLVYEDLQFYFPYLVSNDVKITLIQSSDHILSTMDKQISDYAEKHFSRKHIEVITDTRVREVKQKEVIIQKNQSGEIQSIPCSMAVWATGIRSRPLINQIREDLGLNIQSNRTGLLTDHYLRTKGVKDKSIFAIGDCATVDQSKLLDRIQLLFEDADTKHRGKLDFEQFQRLVQENIIEFPQLELFSTSVEKAFAEANEDKSGYLTLDVLRSTLEKADRKIRKLPATAQVAHQQGIYLAHLFNQVNHVQSNDYKQEGVKPFKYKHKGTFTYVGGNKAILDLTDSPFSSKLNLKSFTGCGAAYLWRSFYLTEMFTGRTRMLLASDFICTRLYGRSISRY